MLAALELSTTQLAVLGFIAGFTIFLGLPIGRLRAPAPRLRVVLNALAIGVLLFLLFDVLSHANEPVEVALDKAVNDNGSWARFVGLAVVFALGLGIGLVGLAYYDGWMTRRLSARSAASRESGSTGAPGSPWSPAKRLAMMIAVGIGLHNFAEGLAIGQSAAAGEISLALLLIIGFGLHNATEGFGIVAPLAADGERASWAFLALVGISRRRTYLCRNPDRPLLRQRHPVPGVPRPGGRVDHLRRDPVAQRRRSTRSPGARHMGNPRWPHRRAGHRLHPGRGRRLTSLATECLRPARGVR